ncbi:MAG: VOC family protein [Candidatus Dormibacteraeota bacterium]|nr:VOC family protein [Candidatus Dormibacteraeota bacterium]
MGVSGQQSGMRLAGIHHISAITGDARRNVHFYTEALGLRLVAKSVNQDDPGVYHLFFGEEWARPGADLTFFEYPGALPGRPGAGMVHRIVWRVGSSRAMEFWQARLAGAGVETRKERRALLFRDPEGLAHELVLNEGPDEPLSARHPEIPAELALQGFAGVRAYSRRPAASDGVLADLLQAERRSDGGWELRGERRGGWISFDPAPEAPARPSAGSVHHVAWSTTDAEQPVWLAELNTAGIPNSGLIDRHFFHSLYFREPGGILYELATEEPGFGVDGPLSELGRALILPPWLEPQRAAIEGRLTPLPDPRATWPVRA